MVRFCLKENLNPQKFIEFSDFPLKDAATLCVIVKTLSDSLLAQPCVRVKGIGLREEGCLSPFLKGKGCISSLGDF